MPHVRQQLAMIAATIVLFLTMLALNHWLLLQFEYAPGINWVFLPAGIRLLCLLLFGASGAIGLLLVSLGVNFLLFFPHDPVRAIAGALLAAFAPWLVYQLAQWRYGLRPSLAHLSAARLLALAVAFAIASPLLHHLWFALVGPRERWLHSLFVMAAGDLNGTLIVLYLAKALAHALPQRP